MSRNPRVVIIFFALLLLSIFLLSSIFVFHFHDNNNLTLAFQSTTINSTASGSNNSSNNSPPVANTGVNQTVNENATVMLNGIASDPNPGDSLTYSWIQTAGPAATAYLAGPDLPVNGMTLTIIKSAVWGERGEESLLPLLPIRTNPIVTV
jgi:hypothetical protein